MSDIKLIALDLDGTLTNEQKVITPHTLAALMEVQQRGVRLVLSSGRPPYGMRPLARQLRMAEYGGMLLCYNGGHVEDCLTGEVLVEKQLPEEVIPHLVRYQEESGMTLMTYYGNHIYTQHPGDKYVAVSSRNNNMEIAAVNDFVRDTPRPLNKCLMVGDPQLVQQWEERWAEAQQGVLHICHSTPYFIEMLPLGIDKGPALITLAERLHLTPDNIMSFGDSYNDLSMLQMAGIGVAMGNAEDKVKAVADYVTASNDDDGVAKALQHFGLI